MSIPAFPCAIENPAWTIVHALSLLYDNNHGKILIDGWFDDVKQLTDRELKQIAQEFFDSDSFKKEYGIHKFVNDAADFGVKKSLAAAPTCNISGLYSGYINNGVKTIIPSNAAAKIDFRLVPNMNPKKQFNKLVSYIRSKDYNEEELEISFISGEAGYRTSLDSEYVDLVIDAAKKVFSDVSLNISSPGTGPMYNFKNLLNVDSICIGSTILLNKMHSPNEFTNIDF